MPKSEAHNFVLVGAGNIGRGLVKDMMAAGKRLNTNLVAIIDPDSTKSRLFQQLVGEKVPSYPDLATFKKNFEGKCEFALVTVPARVRVDIVQRLIDAGLHCLIEKPMAFSAKEAQQIREKARSKNKHVQVILPQRWKLAHLWKDFKPSNGAWTVNSMRTGPFVPRASDVDIVFDYVVEDIDLFVLLDEVFSLSPIKAIRSWGRKVRSNFYDWVSVAIELENGGIFRFFASRLSTTSMHTWEITGPAWHGTMDFRRETFQRFNKIGGDLNAFDAVSVSGQAGLPIELELMTFFSTIKNGVYKGKADFRELSTLGVRSRSILRTHEIIDEILKVMKVVE
jgi:predicted dehydrogenase